MKNLVRIAVVGALAAGCFATAQAQTLPNTGSSDLWLFVSNQSAGTTFAEDTGISINSLAPSADFSANSVLSTAITDSLSPLTPSTALTSYIKAANTAGQTLEWGIEAAQYTLNSAGNPLHPDAQGSIIGLTDNAVSQESNTSNIIASGLETWVEGFNGDLQNFVVPGIGAQPGYAVGGQVYAFKYGSAGASVWGASTGNNGGSINLYGQGPSQANIGLGSEAVLYALTGNAGSTGQVESYILSTALELTSTGALEIVPTTVPLPAAVWLFGSALLGLAGVGRRRATSA